MSKTPKKIAILGSTGSIGTQTLEVVSLFQDRFDVVALTCRHNTDLLIQQIKTFHPKFICVETGNDTLKAICAETGTTILTGMDGLVHIAELKTLDLLIVAIVGTSALRPTYRAIQNGIPNLGLACKEVLVSAGDLMMAEAEKNNVNILPIDSEHAALKQCMASVQEDIQQVQKMILTASGGPFWDVEFNTYETITPAQALRHPNWTMGNKITIDSATMMNKGLEVMEAHHLFQIAYEKIEVLIHPQSIVHALVEFSDGNILSHMGLPDMRFPIQYVLNYPNKLAAPWPKTNLAKLPPLTFHDPDFQKFPLLKLAFEVGEKGGTAPAVLNAANEAAVHLFLKNKIGFLDIHRLVYQTVEQTPHHNSPTIDDILTLDQEIKDRVTQDHSVQAHEQKR